MEYGEDYEAWRINTMQKRGTTRLRKHAEAERDDAQDPAEIQLLKAANLVHERAVMGQPMERDFIERALKVLEEVLG